MVGRKNLPGKSVSIWGVLHSSLSPRWTIVILFAKQDAILRERGEKRRQRRGLFAAVSEQSRILSTKCHTKLPFYAAGSRILSGLLGSGPPRSDASE